MTRRTIAFAALAAVSVLAGCSTSSGGSSPSTAATSPSVQHSAAATTHAATKTAAKSSAAAPTCSKHAPDVIMRAVTPGGTTAERLGGVAFTAAGCVYTLTRAYLASTSPAGAGYCTTVALASKNRGYNADRAPALHDVAASFGAGC